MLGSELAPSTTLPAAVVDDEPGTCLFLQSVVTAERHSCTTFSRGSEAQRYLSGTTVDLVPVDVYLGATNGIDLVQSFLQMQPQ